MDDIKIVIGSWGSYNECNERALGSEWLNLSDFEDWDEIEEELKKEGFELSGIDEELFIQDIDGLPSDCMNWDYANPQKLFETLKESGVLEDEYLYKTLIAYLQVRNWDDFENAVDSDGSRWSDDIHLYEGYDWSEYGRELFECYGYELPNNLEDFIDFEAYGKYMGDCYAQEYDNGIIETC